MTTGEKRKALLYFCSTGHGCYKCPLDCQGKSFDDMDDNTIKERYNQIYGDSKPPVPLIGDLIRMYRTRAGMTQRKFSNKIHVGQSHVSLIERNKVCPSLMVAIDMADVLGISLDELVGRK